MTTPRIILALLVAGSLATGAWAQTTQPLNLKLPPSSTLPAASASSAAPAHAGSSATPGKYYGDTSGTTDAGLAANTPADAADSCDDATYNKTQVHGSVGMGVVSGSHMSGNYQTGTVNLTKAFGDCDHPTGGVSISISGGQGHFDQDRGRYGR
jgi:hypothetical protein